MGELKMINYEDSKDDKKKYNEKDKQKKPFSLFSCEKEEFKDWFDPL
jgi:hypothetical protein